MRRLTKRVALPVAAVVLVGAGVFGGYRLSETGGTTSSTPDQVANTATAAPISAKSATSDDLVAKIAAADSPSVVQINIQGREQTPFGAQSVSGTGSGVIYTSDGYIITNNHVVEGAQNVSVSFADGKTVKGQVVGTDPYTDIAVVKVDRSGLPAAKFGDSKDLQVGQLAVAIGNPSGFESTVTSGLVSGLNRELSSQETGQQQDASLVDLIQTDAAISPGSSGGALIDRNGEVMGITVAYLPQTQTGQAVEGIGFAIPSYTVTSVANQLIDNGQASHPYLGVSLADLTSETASQFGSSENSGAIVANVEQGGPASDAGLRRGDIVTAVDSTKVEDSGDLITALRGFQPGDSVKLTYIRNDDQRSAAVSLGDLENSSRS